ncbi:MAG TPA: hypothetical protein VNV85_03360, partial [Puia sp.]|nr:hypothetical protein [Puia sp.]
IAFLMNEIKDPSSSRINKANAINVIGYFDYSDNDTAEAMETFLLSFIELNINDDEYIHSVIYSLKWAQLTGDRTINELMRLLGNRKNQYIRSAMYSILSVSPSIDLHIDYILEGVDLRYRKEPERESTSLIDERWNLKECVVAICTANGLKKLIEFIISQYHFDYGYNEGETINMILNNSINAFEHDNSLLKLLLKWFLNELKTFNPKRAELILRFFDDTGTREQAFYEIWERSEEGEDRAAALVRLANPSLLNFVIQCYNEHDITNNDLKKFYKDLEWIKSPLLSLFEGLIEEKTNFILEKPAYRDLAAERKKKMDDDFGILFKADTLKKEVSKIFEEEDVLELSFDELFEIRRQHHKPKEMEEHYSGSALRLLRDFCDPDTVVSKADILAWFNNLEMVEWYCVQRIYEILTNNSDLSPGTDQIDWLRNWCYKNINKIDFTNENALRSLMAIYIFYFSVKFNIDYEKEILLSMLSFDYYQDNSPLRTDYLLNKIQKGDIEKRIIENLKKGVKDDNVLKNHVRFAVANKLIEAFPFIRKELINMERNEYSRQELLNIYFPASLDMPGLKSILRDSDHLIRWSILAKLLESGEEQFLISFLMEILTSDNVSDEKLRASEYLILLEQREGVEYLLDELENKPSENLFFQRPNLLNSLRNKDWIPYLMKLLEIGYENNISIDRFENLQSSATTALYNLALLNEENFAAVKENLEAFLQKYKSAYPNVKFLASVIERMEAQFYMNRAQSFTIDQAINKLKILG